MSAWGPDLFEDDVTLDVRLAFEEALSEGLDVAASTKQVLNEFAEYLSDPDDEPLVYLALAALQLQNEALQPDIRKKALDIIASGKALQRWKEAGPAMRAKRSRVLEQLHARLAENMQ